jgi:hypothetical protein
VVVPAPSAPRPTAQTPARNPESDERIDVHFVLNGISGDVFFPCASHLYGALKTTVASVTVANVGRVPLRTLRVEIELEDFSRPASCTIDLDVGGSRVVGLNPVVSEAIATVSEERPGAIRCCVRNRAGQVLYEGRKDITIASRNDVFFIPNVEPPGAFGLLATVVTPNAPAVDQILAEARPLTKTREIAGYQRNDPIEVLDQLEAIYDVIAGRGVGYRSATTTYMGRHGLRGQKVYFPEETLSLTAGNCADGTVLFAAVVEKAAMEPLLVIVPGHVFLGVRERARERGILPFPYRVPAR